MISEKTRRVLKERTTLRTWLAAIVVAIVGVGLLFSSDVSSIWGTGAIQGTLQTLVRDLGGLLFASVAIALLWELVGKRAFLDELWEKVSLAEDIRSSGIIQFTADFNSSIDWDAFFEKAKEIDIFFIYGQTWRRLHANHLMEAAYRHTKFRIVLPDPYDDAVVSEFSRRFSRLTKDQIRDRILDAKSDFESLRTAGAEVRIWFMSAIPLYSFYRFDNIIVWSVYYHHRDKKFRTSKVPAFVASSRGELFKFVKDDFEAAIEDEDGLTKCV